MLAKTLFGLEDLLAEELRKLGASNIEKGTRNVSFEGDRGFMYKVNLCCRTAIKVLKPISAFNVFTGGASITSDHLNAVLSWKDQYKLCQD